MSIGRDTFWTPAHLAIQLGGILVALTGVYLIFSTTFGSNATARAASIQVWGFRGALGAFLACWGGVVMVTSAPFDNWWHNAYGLDVKIVSPPHTLLILGIRTYMGEAAFGDWGWRLPFLLSAILLAISIWIRLKLNESPLFQRMVDEGKQSKRPLTEAFGQWSNAKIALIALFGATAGEAVVWYGGQFYALFFLTQTLKVPGPTAQIMIAIALLIGTPGFIIFDSGPSRRCSGAIFR